MSGTYLCSLFISHSQNFRICSRFSLKFYHNWKYGWNFTVVLLKIFWRVCKVCKYVLNTCELWLLYFWVFKINTFIHFNDYSYITFDYKIHCFWSRYANPKMQVRFKKRFGPIVDQLWPRKLVMMVFNLTNGAKFKVG